MWEDNRLPLWQSAFVTLVFIFFQISSFVSSLTDSLRCPPFSPVWIACRALCVCVLVWCVCVWETSTHITPQSPLPTFRAAAAPLSERAGFCRSVWKTRAFFACRKGILKTLFLCLALTEDAFCVWPPQHPGFRPILASSFPLLILPVGLMRQLIIPHTSPSHPRSYCMLHWAKDTWLNHMSLKLSSSYVMLLYQYGLSDAKHFISVIRFL